VCADRLKVTLAEGYFASRIAWSCLYQQKVYSSMQYHDKDMLFWCKREVKWAAESLLKAHQYQGGSRPDKWNDGDQMVVQVRATGT
jgi:hypothetical protein